MKMRSVLVGVMLLVTGAIFAQAFAGKVSDESGNPIEGVEVLVKENNETATTGVGGTFGISQATSDTKTLVFYKEGYTYEQLVDIAPTAEANITLRTAVKSFATLREEGYLTNGCNTVNIPDDSTWNIEFEITELKGDLAPNSTYTRRDPSAVILVDGTYYMWYSYSLTHDAAKDAPWDLNDLYYATSTDGETWTEQGAAVVRGEAGSYDHRSVFTTEVLAHDGMYYLVYQCAADEDGIYNRNTVGISTATSPNGPWTKLEEPVLHPTYTTNQFFDNNAVHDPCIVPYNGKFYLYYKGECNCHGANDCVRWCDPICGLDKQVKWGVAIADAPTGPYVKSASNPITNTGHEVMVWPYKTGMAILQHQDGPEAMSIQYAENGLDFEIMGTVAEMPEAAGLYRTATSTTDPHAGVNWGVGHKLMWDDGPNGWMYIYRYDKVKKK